MQTQTHIIMIMITITINVYTHLLHKASPTTRRDATGRPRPDSKQ